MRGRRSRPSGAGPPSAGGSQARAPLLERSDELERLESALAQAAAGDGRIVLVEGAAGVGKTALVRAAGGIASDMGLTVVQATGRQIEQGFGFGVVIQLLTPVLESFSPPQREELLDGAAAFARPLLERGPQAGSGGDLHATLHGLHWLCVNLAARGPLAVCVDDAQWADRASLTFLPYLAARIAELPACLIVAVRSGENDEGDRLAEALAGSATTLRPAPLSEAAVAQLAASRLSRELPAGFVRECAETTGGNPLFVLELLRHLDQAGGAVLDDVGSVAPPSVGRVVLERIRRMAGDAADVVRALAIVGDGAEPRLVAHVAGTPSERVECELDRLIAAGLLEDGLPPRFEHPIVRQAVYDSIAPAARARGHLAAARELARRPDGAELAAAHLLETAGVAEPAGAEAVAALRAAAVRARARGASEQGIRFLARALDEPLDRRTRREVLLELGTEELRLGREAAVERLREAEELSEHPEERAGASLAVSVAQTQTGALADAIATCDRALEAVGSGDRELRLGLLAQHGNASWIAGTMSEDERRLLRASERDVAQGETPAERLVLTILAVEAAQSGTRPARKVAELAGNALRGGRLLAELGAEHPSYTLAVAAQTLAGDFAAAIEEWSRGIEHSRRRGSLYGYANALFSRAYARQLAGDLAGAEADAIEALGLLPESDLITAPLPFATAAHVAVERGDLAADVEDGLERHAARDGWPPISTVNYAILASGWLALSRGDAERALARFEECGRRTELTGWTGPTSMTWRSGAARALASLGRHEEALAWAEDELARATAYDAPGPVGIALGTMAVVAGRDERVDLARAAADTLAGSEAALEHAKALVGLGMALRRAGAPRDARTPLREGMDLANRCGSDAAVARAMNELRAAGMRPRRPAVRGAHALTPQERQTARLAASGLSNREIAEAMFLTRRTVEMHLTGAYRKLEIGSRAELADALERELPGRDAA